jgi:hypothetical protein
MKRPGSKRLRTLSTLLPAQQSGPADLAADLDVAGSVQEPYGLVSSPGAADGVDGLAPPSALLPGNALPPRPVRGRP